LFIHSFIIRVDSTSIFSTAFISRPPSLVVSHCPLIPQTYFVHLYVKDKASRKSFLSYFRTVNYFQVRTNIIIWEVPGTTVLLPYSKAIVGKNDSKILLILYGSLSH